MTPVTQILFLSIKPGKINEFLEADRNFLASATLPKGLVGSRLYRSPDGKSAVRVVQYESAEAHTEYHRTKLSSSRSLCSAISLSRLRRASMRRFALPVISDSLHLLKLPQACACRLANQCSQAGG